MRHAMTAVALGAAAALPLAVQAADFTKNAYGAVLGEYVHPDDERDADYGLGGRLLYGIPLAPKLNVEFSFFGNVLKRESDNGDDTQFGLGADLMFPLRRGDVTPFLLLGGGGVREQLDTSLDTDSINAYLNAGAGLLFQLTDRLSARAEARWMMVFNDGSYNNADNLGDGRFGLGVQYAFGAPYTPPAEPVAPPPPPPPPPADSDGDGVIDPDDRCPNTPKGVKVDAKGCPLDTDGDGVPDHLDECPNTPKGFKVDTVGCIIEQKIVLRGVNFEFDRDLLTAEAKAILDAIAPGIVGQPKLTLEVGGHTDARGSDAYNKALSQRRAEAVRRYFLDKGVAAERLRAVGYGESRPIASNDTDEGRAENRRVELEVLNKPLSVKVIKKK